MVPRKLVQNTLRECLGSALAGDPSLVMSATDLLDRFSPGKDSLRSLSLKMEDFLFNALYERLGPAMTLRMEDGSARRILTGDLPALADHMLFPLLASLKQTPENYAHIHADWMESGSFSAMRALLLVYGRQLPSAEAEMIRRIVRENLPPAWQEAWFSFPRGDF